MKLCYRGIPYQPKSTYLPVAKPEVKGKYRSQPWQKSKYIAVKPISFVPYFLKFRGCIYERNCFALRDRQISYEKAIFLFST